MRWDDLFGDLEAQLEAAEAASVDAEVADRTRRESALITLGDRLGGSLGERVGVHVVGAGRVDGHLLEVAAQWLLLAEDRGAEVLVPLAAVQALADLAASSSPGSSSPPSSSPPSSSPGSGLPARSAPPSAAGSAGQARLRLGLGVALRALARDRAPVVVHLTGGATVEGTLERVGADFVELTEHPAAEIRPRAGGAVRTLPFAALAMVRSRA